ncbi:MAG: dihydrodipicolinate synthase family protein [Planctomycetes bacterium]|nr:dihydrodipicolinate synthase family protein [Planctomycetota bacterium]MCH9728021.1 dihydrodipicolinate synthase family protein [Planctomycetota bacterium]MCH9775823.1 dihydrodipicolinate synthase family protein [Planctomycetota bacterium]MCH9793502.1 dihydrodipicolinate synthase family protein [Planctomycetota bacterium]MDF1744673.1 dihydrodipicolinate synthase family protein [Gimesia sp.]
MTIDLSEQLKGVLPPVITPLTPERRLDHASAESVYQFMLKQGAHGIFLFGTSGEGPLLCDDDRQAATDIAVKVIDGKVPLLAGVIAPGTEQIIEQARVAKAQGADAIVVCPPFYYPAGQQDMLVHYRTIRESVDIPIFAYDIPVMTKVKMEMDTLMTLGKEGTIIGVKDSSGDAVSFHRLVSSKPEGMKLFTGAEMLVHAVMMAGADGTVPGLANVAPEIFVQLYEAVSAGNHQEAVQLQEAIVRLFEVFVCPDGTIKVGYVIGVMKTALHLRGVIEHDTLFHPFPACTPELIERTRGIMEEVGCL